MAAVTPFDRDGRDAPLRTPPNSVEAEQAVLGGLLLDNRVWERISDRVGEDDFYRRDHRVVFRAIRHLLEIDQPADAVTVAEWLSGQKLLEDAGGLEYLGRLVRDTPSAANVRAYADIVRERSVLRQLIEVGGTIASSGFEPGGRNSSELLDEAERKVFEIAEQTTRNRSGFQTAGSVLVKVVERIDELYERDNPITGLPTGLT